MQSHNVLKGFTLTTWSYSMSGLLKTAGLISSVFIVGFMAIVSPCAYAVEIDQTGYESIVIDPPKQGT
jgi:hypothetical protein